jgi:hypothetical protein
LSESLQILTPHGSRDTFSFSPPFGIEPFPSVFLFESLGRDFFAEAKDRVPNVAIAERLGLPMPKPAEITTIRRIIVDPKQPKKDDAEKD